MSMSIITAGVETPAVQGEVIDFTPVTPGWLARKVKQPIERRKLVRVVAQYCSMARDHEANGTPAGAHAYQLLCSAADQAVDAYGEKWAIDRKTLDAQLPSLNNLRKLAYPQTQGKAGLAVFGLVLAVVLPLLAGAWCGLFPVAYGWVFRHLGG